MNSQHYQDKLDEDDLKLEQLCYAALNNPQGKELLTFLHQRFLMAPVADPDKEIGHACFREGQNNLIRSLRTAIKFHAARMRGNNDGTND